MVGWGSPRRRILYGWTTSLSSSVLETPNPPRHAPRTDGPRSEMGGTLTRDRGMASPRNDRRPVRSLVVAALVTVGVFTSAQTPPSGKYVVYGQGTQSCGTWMTTRDDDLRRLLQSTWIAGFVSAAGWTGAVLQKTDQPGLDIWIDRYCATHPTAPLSSAAEALVLALRQ